MAAMISMNDGGSSQSGILLAGEGAEEIELLTSTCVWNELRKSKPDFSRKTLQTNQNRSGDFPDTIAPDNERTMERLGTINLNEPQPEAAEALFRGLLELAP